MYSVPTETTAELLMAAARALRRAYADELAGIPGAPTPSQARALAVVVDLDGPRLSAVAERLRIAPRSATEVVDALETLGAVERRPDPGDRRATCVVVTDHGRALYEQLTEVRRRASEALLAGLPAPDRAELDRILRLLVTQ